MDREYAVSEVAHAIALGWMDGSEENTQEELEAAVAVFGRMLAVQFECQHGGDDARLSLAQTLRDTADEIEEATGRMIQRDARRQVA